MTMLLAPSAKTIGLTIRSIRDARQWTQADLATRAGLKQSTISLVEQGRSQNPENLGKVAIALGYALSQLIAGAERLENQEGAMRGIVDTAVEMGEALASIDLDDIERRLTRRAKATA